MRAVVARTFPIGAVGLLLLLFASPAAACNCPALMVVGPMGGAARHAAGPGDRVTYSITELTAGATWSIAVNGTEVAQGTSTGSAVRGSFVVPDLGGSDQRVGV